MLPRVPRLIAGSDDIFLHYEEFRPTRLRVTEERDDARRK